MVVEADLLSFVFGLKPGANHVLLYLIKDALLHLSAFSKNRLSEVRSELQRNTGTSAVSVQMKLKEVGLKREWQNNDLDFNTCNPQKGYMNPETGFQSGPGDSADAD